VINDYKDNKPLFPIPYLHGPGNTFFGSVIGLPYSSLGGIIFTNYVSPIATEGA
jgi:hypothetical protein